ncbi:hypothetical protein QJS04_geneDACA010215 [Acorus gramineus]|uniref:Uncharacterized protein n=1 Tax=Acorus gramineus TaxID=55184 RepID=A0AAV9A656_ACOGR|nr:hypothetical protein QJS04_geneDACA010215 [Acorus gramineus]
MAGLRSFMVALVIFLVVMGPTLSSAISPCYPDCIKRCHKRHGKGLWWFCPLECIDYCLSHPSVPLSEDKVAKVGAHVGGRKAVAPIPRA